MCKLPLRRKRTHSRTDWKSGRQSLQWGEPPQRAASAIQTKSARQGLMQGRLCLYSRDFALAWYFYKIGMLP
jgi:hypothetical protein